MSSAVAITNLLYRYGEMMDVADFDGASDLLRHATLKLMGDREIGGLDMREVWHKMVVLDAEGRPNTRHVITNPILDIDERAGEASCRSCYTVLQSLPGFPLQIIASGRYHDRFARVDGHWRFTFRDYSMFDFQGDLSQHLRM